MKAGYLGELAAREAELNTNKTTLEGLYMTEKSEKDIEESLETKKQFSLALNNAEKIMPMYATTIKSVKMAIESQLSKI